MFSSFATFVLVFLGFGSLALAQGPTCVRNYVVVLGDTCDLISAKTDTSTFQLTHVNAGTINADCSNLALGEPLCLGQQGQDCRATTVVQSGDGCDTLAASVGITEALLLHNNPNLNAGCTNLYPGEVLCASSQNITYT